jgi:subtilisin family serine protease
MVIFFIPCICFSEENFSTSLKSMSANPKLIHSQSVLSEFANGESTTRIIVNLRKPAQANTPLNLQSGTVRRQLRTEVNAAINSVVAGPSAQEIKITNRFKYVYGFSAEVTLKGLQALLANGDVVSIEKDFIVYPNLAQGIPLMNATTARSTYSGSGLSVAICDTGIDYTHSRLGGGGFPNLKVIGGYDCGENKSDPMDGNGHGTACAGIVAGDLGTVGDYIGGVAYSAKLYALKITFTPTEGSAYTSDMIEAWDWCVTHQNDDPNNPIMIISTSFGGGRYYDVCDRTSTAMTAAAANAVSLGMTLFVSSGNDGYCDSMGWPACISHVISVGAVYDAGFTTSSIGWCVASGSCADKMEGGCSSGWYSLEKPVSDSVIVYSNTASFLGILAPSNWATTTKLGGGYYDTAYGFGGTSAACPYAAGAAALLQSAAKFITGSYLTPTQVKSKLVDTGNLITDGKVNITKPRVNVAAAIKTLSGSTSALQYSWNMDTNPGWVTQGLWAWGHPVGGGGQYGGPDPANGYTGSNVYGYNLSGDYENGLAEKHLTSSAINCAGLSNVSLKYRRWLGVEKPAYDHAYLRVSNNGTSWTTVWQNGAQIADTSWVLQDLDISSVADGQSTVYLRWTMGSTDSSWQYCGWNIDDVEIWGTGQGAVCPSCPADGLITNVTYPVGVSCSCSNAVAITIGTGVTVPNGSNVTFTAPVVNLDPGFHAANGANVTVRQPSP